MYMCIIICTIGTVFFGKDQVLLPYTKITLAVIVRAKIISRISYRQHLQTTLWEYQKIKDKNSTTFLTQIVKKNWAIQYE